MSAHDHIYSSQSGRSSKDFVYRMIRTHVLTYYFIILHSVFNLIAASRAYMPDVLVLKTSTLKEYLSLLPLPWQPTTAQLNPLHIFIFTYIEKVSIQLIFYPVLTWISMETGRSCQARWRIAVTAHNIRVLIGLISCQSSSLRTVN